MVGPRRVDTRERELRGKLWVAHLPLAHLVRVRFRGRGRGRVRVRVRVSCPP